MPVAPLRGIAMKTADAIAEILRREGVEWVIGYPVNHILERGAALGLRPIIVRQQRPGLHMPDAISRVTSGAQIGVFCMQHGPGTENAYGGVAQAFSESVPILVMPQGYAQNNAYVKPNFNSTLNFQHVTKSVEPLVAEAQERCPGVEVVAAADLMSLSVQAGGALTTAA